MNTINISKNKYNTLTNVKIDKNVFNTEAKIYNFEYRGQEKILKKLYDLEGSYFAHKLYTIEMLDYYKKYIPDSLCIPDNLVSVNNKIIGFSLPKLDGINFATILNSEKVDYKEKIYYFKAIGTLLNQLKSIRKYTELKEFYLNDLHESNFMVDPYKRDIKAVDLDSCRIFNNGCFASRFLGPNDFICNKPFKYNYNDNISNGRGFVIANENSDLYCYVVMILNYLFNGSVTRMREEKFYDYLNYLDILGFDKSLINCFEKIILNCDNSNPVDYLDTLTESNINGAKEKIYMLNKTRSD